MPMPMPMPRMLWGFVGLLLVAGCQSTEKKCEHARDVMLSLMEAHAKEALATVPPPDRAGFESDIKADIDHARSVFVQECTKLDAAGMECIARIDELIATQGRIEEAVDRAYGECPKDALGLVEMDCIEFARKDAVEKEKAASKGPDCDPTLDALAERIQAGAPTASPPTPP